MSGASANDLLSSAMASTLAPHLDEDTAEYVTSLLSEDPSDTDAREAVMALVSGSVEEDADDICTTFFQLLDFGSVGSGAVESGDKSSAPSDADTEAPMRRLEQSVTLKEKDVTTFASGLSAELSTVSEFEQKSQIQAFYANMIDPSQNEAAVSERARRKSRQKALREAAEEEERMRAIADAMAMIEDEETSMNEKDSRDTELEDIAANNARDVHFRDFDLPNLRGGGPDLLARANLTLAHGRRYGLMGRNGCGKTTLMSFIAGRQINDDAGGGVPKNMSMLLVRQEIIGNEWTAVETVLKSDVRREGVKRYIEWCEKEIDRLEKGEPVDEVGSKVGDEDESAAAGKRPKEKSRQKLRDKKRLANKKKASALDPSSKSSRSPGSKSKEIDEKAKAKLADKLARSYQKLAEIEEEEGDPEPRARKVLAGLGFSGEMMNKSTRELSGGWRMRVSLSCALFASPALLLLDEPTNHLDLEAVLWLEKYLCSKFKGSLVVVSHDRHFLNNVVTDVVHFYRDQLTTYKGDISNFEAVREEERQRQIGLYETQEAKKQHLQKYIDLHAQSGENGVKAAKQRKSRMKKLEKVGVMSQEGRRYKASYDGDAEEVEEYQEDEKVELNFPDPGSFDGNMVCLEQVSFGYTPESILLKNVDLSVNINTRTALVSVCGFLSSVI